MSAISAEVGFFVIPSCIYDPINMIGNSAVPMILMAFGMSLHGTKPLQDKSNIPAVFTVVDDVSLFFGRLFGRKEALPQAGAVAGSSPMRVDFGALTLDEGSGVCYAHGEALELSSREFTMLSTLMERPAHAVTRERLWEKVFADGRDAQPDAIEVVAYRLRKKITGLGVELVALRGVGYLIREKRPD